MSNKDKMEILKQRINFLEKENKSLRDKLEDLPKVKQTLCDLNIAKQEYDKLLNELHEQINKYKQLNKELYLIKDEYKRELVKEIKAIKKIKKK